MDKLEIKYIPIDIVKPNEYNPKQMTASDAVRGVWIRDLP